jgi:CO/xanthine dehydrogenase Mo-binding subunit
MNKVVPRDRSVAAYGASPPRLESNAKVTGRAEYTHNLALPNMLFGKIFRSSIAHGRIRSIDTSEAKTFPGVYGVYTIEDIKKVVSHPYYGPAFHDQPVLAHEKVRHVGEAVAVVLAGDPHIAEQAAQLIVADYEELPAVYDEVEAVTSSALVHEELKPAKTFADLKHLAGRSKTNVTLEYNLNRGDVDRAFEEADNVFEHTFKTQTVTHTPLEPFVTLGEVTGSTLTLHTASQMPSFVRIEIARLLGWPESRVRVKVLHLGGGFAAKSYIKLEAIVALLTLLVKRPVKIAATMDEQFYVATAHAATFRIKSAVSKEGRVTARKCDVWWNGGAYADIGPRVAQKSGFTAPGPYDIENVRISSSEIYTNLPPSMARRGFGIPKLSWAYESHTDIIARALRLDPIEFRRRNILREGAQQATGTVMPDDSISLVLERTAELMNWKNAFDHGKGVVKRGRGIAIGFKAAVAPTTSVASLTINADGSCSLNISTVDMGQGSDTAMAQIAAEVLGISPQDIKVSHPDTDLTPFDMGTLGSRSTYHMGNAVKLAAENARDRLKEMAQGLGLPEGSNYPIRELFLRRYGMQAGNVIGVGTFIPLYTPPSADGLSKNVTPYWMVGATGVELEVDSETGRVHLTKLITVADCGTLVNPRIAETQLSGAAIMQIGYALFEKMDFDAGQVTNASLADYKIPGMHVVPPALISHFVEGDQQGGPFGAKGVGESGSFGVAPAVANAIDDAIGVRLTSLPMTAESVLRGLREKQGRTLGDIKHA